MAFSLLHAFPTRGDRLAVVDVASSRYPSVGMHKHRTELAGSATRRPKRTPFVCSSSHDENQESASERICESRRELIKAASMTGLSLLANSTVQSSPTWAAPIMPPDLDRCVQATMTASPDSPKLDCCLLLPTKPIIDFQLPCNPTRHQRRPAQKASQDYINKYNRAYEHMRNLPYSDPRSFMRQAEIHCAFCNGAYFDQLGSNNKLQVHFSWIFLPWHRWYLYFHERILAHLIGDPSFSLVFWNWDNQTNEGGNIMPTMFTKNGTALYDAKRNQNHLPPVLTNLNVTDDSTNTTLTNDQIIQDNLSIMYNSIVKARTANLFMGMKYSAGGSEPHVGGTLEMSPHTAIHIWTGDNREPFGQDLGNFSSAARDPIFYAHHSNVDRLWTVWNTIGGRRKDHTDPDFLGATFVFYDENGRMVRVKTKDALDSSKLGVYYDKVAADKLWLNFKPSRLSSITARTENIQEIGPARPDSSPRKVGKKLVCLVKRPIKVARNLVDQRLLDKDDTEEVLVLEDVQVPRNVATHIAVFINSPDADEKTPLSCAEYVGSFINVPHSDGAGMDMSSQSARFRFGISDNIKQLGITDLSTLTVTLVPKLGNTEQVPITLKGIQIEYE